MFGELQRTFEFKCIPKELFSVSKRHPSRVVAIEVEQIEEIEPYRDPAKQIGGRMRDLHAFLKLRKAGDPILERDDLAIDDEESGLLLMNRRRDLRIPVVQQDPVPREEAQIATAAKSQAALAIPLRFKEPSLAREAFVRECRQHRSNPFGLRSFPKAGFDLSRQPNERIGIDHAVMSLSVHDLRRRCHIVEWRSHY